ncbi:MAG TPA: SMP-30/gluconolactonase/LRE family protein [Actinomycetes bacterium]|nr:SMP-30/gluconolactonase/LRE family protein [Actinomycetes bacterium]
MTLEAERFGGRYAFHGEGPVWFDGRLHLVDLFAGDVLSVDAEGALHERVHVDRIAAAVRPRSAGGWVLGVERGFALRDPDGTLHTLPEVWSDPAVRMNDGATDPFGGFYCGSMAYDHEHLPRAGTLYRLDASGDVRAVLAGVTISNGLAWSPDGSRAYYVDTPTSRVDVLDSRAPGELVDRRPFVDTTALSGVPDGLTVDAEGGVWVAFYGGGCVRRFAPDGRLIEQVDLPVSRPTSCAFGGPGLTDLFVTTSRENLPDDAEPDAGALFRAQTSTLGLPVVPYAG